MKLAKKPITMRLYFMATLKPQVLKRPLENVSKMPEGRLLLRKRRAKPHSMLAMAASQNEKKKTMALRTPASMVEVTISPLLICQTSWPKTARICAGVILDSKPVETATIA